MMAGRLFLAQIEPVRPGGGGGLGKLPGLGTDILAIVGAGIFVFVVLMIWAVYFRKKPREGPSPSRVSYRVREDGNIEEQAGHKRRHRRRRKEHRGRNPTLAETGGLPPPRPQDVPPQAT